MSLLLSPHASPRNNNQHLAPSIGDIDTILDPELTRDDSLSFMSDNNEPKPKIEEDLPDLTPEALVKILSNPGSSLPRLVSRRSINKNREYTTEEKIVQIHKGQHVLGALKGGMYFVGEPQLVPDTVIRQAIQINYKKHNDGTLEMINQVQLKKQKQVLGHLMKQFGSALFTGKSIMNISLPVSIFESQSHLEREARSLSYAPHFLEKGGSTTNPLEQFKLAAAQFVSSLHLGSNPQKPFNPVLGETFQGKIGDCPVYVEQISHHPPAAATQLFGKNFTLEAKIEFTAAISMNSVKSAKIGFFKVTYKNTRTVIRVHYPQTLMTGTAIGKRNFQFADKFSIFDIENGHYAEICFDNNETHLFKKKSKAGKDQFSGAIWKVNNIFIEKLKQVARRPQDIENLKFKEKEHAIARLENIEGSWLEYLKIGNQVYWSFGELLPFKLQYSQNPLPSDSNYRLDVLYLRAEDEIKSQKNKEIMEESQRYDRKLRENYKKRFAK